MQKLQDSVFSIVKTTNLSSAVFSYLQPTDDYSDKTPLGGIFSDAKFGWLALGPKFCVIDLRTGLKVAAWTFNGGFGKYQPSVTNVAELPTPLRANTRQLIISLEWDGSTGMICVFHVNGSQILHCIQTEAVVSKLAVSDSVPDGPFACFDGVVTCGTRSGEIFVLDLNRAGLLQALKDTSQGHEDRIHNETNSTNVLFLPINNLSNIEHQKDVALSDDNHIAVLLNESSHVDGQYIFRNPDGSVRMKAKKDHINVSTIQYIPQLGSVAVGYNFGAFQIWNLMTLELEFTSQVNVECLPVTHIGFQEPCDDPRAFCYMWVVYSVIDRFEEEVFPLAVMYSLTYQGKRMLSDTKYLYEEFITSAIRFQVELSGVGDDTNKLVGGRCITCHTYSIPSTLGDDGEDSMLNLCQLVWECWGQNINNSVEHGMLLFDLDQWYKDQMPATYRLESTAFMSATHLDLARDATTTLDLRLCTATLMRYSHAIRLEEHFFPNCLQYKCVCLSTAEACTLGTAGVQRQAVRALAEAGPAALLRPARLYRRCVRAGLAPLYVHVPCLPDPTVEEQRRFVLSVALEARLSGFLQRCARAWAAGGLAGAGCTLTFLVDWCWTRAIDLKQNAKELIAPLFTSTSMPDRNVCRCLEHCVRQLTQLTSLLDAVLTKCCNLIVPDALSEIEEKFKGIGTVALYFQVVQWFLNVGLLPERQDSNAELGRLPYPEQNLVEFYQKRRLKLQRLQDNMPENNEANKSCSLLYIDQLIEHECGGEKIYEMWRKGGSDCDGLYPPPSLYSLLRLYLLPDIAEEHKHSLVLYLLVDYSMIYDELRYEAIIRRLMQFPTMFGLSNTAIKATQAFWHLDHRDFDFALDQLQCLTGNALSEWQHQVVLSSLLAQKKTQAALQYLHVRKPAPMQNLKDSKDVNTFSRVSDHDKLDDWQSCCNLYLARGLVFEALDVIRMCAQHAQCADDKVKVLNFFYKNCRNTGLLSKLLQVTLLPFEEEVFIKYLQCCDDSQTSDILIMYYLQQARYLEAQQYNKKLCLKKTQQTDLTSSLESLYEVGFDRSSVRNTLVEVICSSLPSITSKIANYAMNEFDSEPHVIAPKPMSVFIQARSPKNKFTYKSTFIQDTIENASETWVHKPKLKRGVKEALNIEDTPFICTPKLTRAGRRSIFDHDMPSDASHTPPKRQRLDLTNTPKTPRNPPSAVKLSAKVSREMQSLLEMPEVQVTPKWKVHDYERRSVRETTPQSILKQVRRIGTMERDNSSPVDSRYLDDTDDDMLETGSFHTHYSDNTAKHLRFTIPTASESGSTPSPAADGAGDHRGEEETSHPFESPPKKMAVEDFAIDKKIYKDNVRARKSLSISANSSLADDPSASIESIADIPITLINPRYSDMQKRRAEGSIIEINNSTIELPESDASAGPIEINDTTIEMMECNVTPRARRALRPASSSRSVTPERQDSPIVTLMTRRALSSRSVTPERQDSSTVITMVKTPSLRSTTPERQDSPTVIMMAKKTTRTKTPELEAVTSRSPKLDAIPEQPKQEVESEAHPAKTTLSVLRLRSTRSRTPERMEVPSTLEIIAESPTKSDETDERNMSPRRRSLRSRSKTPEGEVKEPARSEGSPRSLRSRSKTPERDNVKILSPRTIEKPYKVKKSLSRMVLEANTFAKTKADDKPDSNESPDKSLLKDDSDSSVIECTPMKPNKPQSSTLLDVSFSPIVNKSILQSSSDSMSLEASVKEKALHMDTDALVTPKTPKLLTMSETFFDKSVLRSYESSVAEDSVEEPAVEQTEEPEKSFGRDRFEITSTSANSILKDVSSLITSDSEIDDNEAKTSEAPTARSESETTSAIQKEKQKIGEIEREIDEIEGISVTSDTDEEMEEGSEDGEEEESESEESSSSEEENVEGGANDVISIGDSSDGDTSSSESNKLLIDENVQSDTPENGDEVNKELVEEEIVSVVEIENVEDNEEFTKQSAISDPLNQENFSLLTDDNSVLESDHSGVKLNYSHDSTETVNEQQVQKPDDKDEEHIETVAMETDNEPQEPVKLITVEENLTTAIEVRPVTETISEDTEIIDSNIVMAAEKSPIVDMEVESTTAEKNMPDTEIDDSVKTSSEDNDKQSEITAASIKDDKPTETVTIQETIENKIESAPENIENITESTQKQENIEMKTIETTHGDNKTTPSRRTRTKSNSSTKSDATQKTPENTESDDRKRETPSSSRGKARTPSDSAPRRIMTRRASKELSESRIEDENESLTLTPSRRTRSKSKNIDDNVSVASDTSIKSGKSKASVRSEDVAARKTRKSLLPTKPDLSVIPESTTEDGSKMDVSDIINEYSRGRRLTRHQKSLLESLMEPTESGAASSPRAFHVQPIDPISLLDKEDFEGPPDVEELHHTFSTDSEFSDSSVRSKNRMARAASETKSLGKRIPQRRLSVDIVKLSPAAAGAAAGGRARRASFTRARDALTPKRRQQSDHDAKQSEVDSVPGSPAASSGHDTPGTPSRRTRRAASTQSNTSQSKSETGRRSKQ